MANKRDLAHALYCYPCGLKACYGRRLCSMAADNAIIIGLIASGFAKQNRKKIIALGGISQKNLKLLNLVNCSGFAGISYFG